MKSLPLLSVLLFEFVSCNANPPIGPDPIDASTSETSSSSSSASSASSSASSSSSSSTSSSGGGPRGDGSGTRLKRYMYTSVDGMSVAQGHRFFDAALQADCVPVRTIGGLRCITGMNGAFVVQYYSDAACTMPLVYGYRGCATPVRVQIGTASTCAIDAEFQIMELSPYASATMYSMAPGCLAVPTNAPAIYDIYQLGPEVDYAQFAPMTLEHE